MIRQSNTSLAEQYQEALMLCVSQENEALRLDKLRKRILSELVIRIGGAIGKAEHEARADHRYREAEDNWVRAQSDANLARAKVDGLRLRFEEWRTRAATERAEMNLR